MLERNTFSYFLQRHQEGVELVEILNAEMSEIENFVHEMIAQETEELKKENARLKQELREWQEKVVKLERERGINQIPVPGGGRVGLLDSMDLNAKKLKLDQELETPKANLKEKPAKKDKEATKKKEKAKSGPSDSGNDEAKDMNVSRLDFRIGRIVSVEKHPDADSLYVEKIDLGEQQPRTVVSGLVKFVPIENMQDRLVVVLCNLKPVKMRGILSEAMVMCASTPDKVEVLIPPNGAAPGDRVTCSDFPGTPDSILNPKKKIFEQIAPDLKTNEDCLATYKGSPLVVNGKGSIKSESLTGVPIK